MKISIIIPNWNGKNLLKKHLPSVIAASNGAEIIVVDDHSTDDSIQFINKNYPSIKVVQKDNHEGFSSTVNVGAKHALGDILVLLNSDIKPEKDFLVPLLHHFKNTNVFAVGCMDKSIESDGSIVLRGRGIAQWKNGMYVHSRGETNQYDTAWVNGGSGAFRKIIWQKLGGMDERFNPFYWEDIDLSYRAVRAGYTILFEPKSIVWHYHEIGKIKSEYSADTISRIAYRNQFLFLWKHTPGKYLYIQMFQIPKILVGAALSKNLPLIIGFFQSVRRIFDSSHK
jgi:GT2 family glycosyltransferase